MEKIKDINQGDVLTFIATDGNYKVLLCTSTNKDKSPHYFTFCALTYDHAVKPTIDDVIQSSFYGVGKTKNDLYRYSENELEKMWAIHPEIKPNILGSYGFVIWKKDFTAFREHFECIGQLRIVDHLDKNGSGSVNASDWNFLVDFFSKELYGILSNRGQKTFQVKAIVIG